MLGLTVAASQLFSLGFAGVAVATVVVVVTMVGTSVVARALGLDLDVSLLIATGTAICGASAIAAVETLTDSSEENVGYALITVTVFGTIAMVTTPSLALHALHLDARQTGLWLGGSIHEVAQVAGAGAAASAAALQAAVLTKLTRVVMLAPTTAVIALRRGRRNAVHAVPGFVLAFLAFAALRSVADLPESIVTAGHTASTLLLSAGLCALATQIDVKGLAAVGLRPLGLGLAAWLLASSAALGTALLVTS